MPSSATRPPALLALAVILFLEAALVTVLAVWLLIDLLTLTPEYLTTAIAIFVLTALAAVWVIVTAAGILRRRAWARASTVTIQILQIAVAVGCFQGLVARPDLGWALLVPALVAGVLALTPSVVRATVRNTEQHE
ncbi:hypothetical protein [Leifsonia aquatica]|uniref:hypothetical protein n=1 Tax=Leifsonia aquatica TaxID=144185 RepID=UPI000468ADD3|nr:hypothetical protein [Leifsonia aquatica]